MRQGRNHFDASMAVRRCLGASLTVVLMGAMTPTSSVAASRAAAPAKVSASARGNAIVVHWQFRAGAERGVVRGYQVAVRRSAEFKWSTAQAARSDRTLVVPVGGPGNYVARVRSLASRRHSGWSATTHVRIDDAPAAGAPSAPAPLPTLVLPNLLVVPTTEAPPSPTTPEVEPTTPEVEPTTPEVEPTTPEVEPTTPEVEPTTPEVEPTTPEVEPTTPEVEPTTPEVEPTTPEVEPTTPEVEPTTPEVEPTTPEVEPTTPEVEPTTPEVEPTTPEVEPTTPEVEPTTPEVEPTTPEVEPTTPLPTTPEVEPTTPEPTTPLPDAPLAPAGLKTQLGAVSGALVLRWAAPADAAAITSYEVAYRVQGSATFTPIAASTDPGAVQQAVSVPPGAVYSVGIRAVGPGGEGPWAERTVAVPQSTLPVLRVDTAGEAPIVSKEDYLSGTVTLVPQAGGDQSTAFTGATEIRGRGNSTWEQPKKPYKLKLSKSTSILGMPKNKHWALLADAFDASHVRNAVAFDLGARTTLGWSPRTKPVELVINGEYLGLYTLAETVRIDPNRVNIDAMGAADNSGNAVTGGYLLERDARWDPAKTAGFASASGELFTFQDPEAPTSQQRTYINTYVNDTEAALFGDDFTDPSVGYAHWIDVDTFVDWYILHEWTLNFDAWQLSTNLVKPRGGTLRMGPPWDFDLSMGRKWDPGDMSPIGSWVNGKSPWFARLLQDPTFVAKVHARWATLRMSPSAINALVSAASTPRTTAALFDRQVWGYAEDPATEQTKVAQFLADRAAWLDTVWGD